jgi:hypothetical protein
MVVRVRSKRYARDAGLRVVALLTVWASITTTSLALSAPPPEVDALHAQGLAAFKRQDYEAARIAFARSYELAPRTSTLLNLALAELNSGRPLDAVKHLRLFVGSADAPAVKVEEVRTKMLPRAEAQIGRLQIDAPAGAHVLVDNVEVGVAPLPDPIDVMPGSHEIAVRLGSDTSTMRVPVAAGDVSRVRVDLQKAMPAVVVNEPTPAGSKAPPTTSTAGPQSNQPASGSWWTPRTITIGTVAAAAVVATGIGVGFGVASTNDAHDADSIRATLSGNSACTPKAGQQLPAQCALLADATSSQSTHHDLATGFYIGGAALAVGAVATWLLWPSPKENAPHAWVRPVIGKTPGLELGGAF